jgi:hypothetical protein
VSAHESVEASAAGWLPPSAHTHPRSPLPPPRTHQASSAQSHNVALYDYLVDLSVLECVVGAHAAAEYAGKQGTLMALAALLASPERNVANPPASRAAFFGGVWIKALMALLL